MQKYTVTELDFAVDVCCASRRETAAACRVRAGDCKEALIKAITALQHISGM